MKRSAGRSVILGAFVALVAASAAPSGVLSPAQAVHAAHEQERVVKRADVDGDGRTDVVRVRDGDNRVRVTVDRARGRTLRRTLGSGSEYEQPSWHGAANLNGRRGKELAVLTRYGAHSLFFSVLTVRHGKLVLQRAPGGKKTWFVDGAAWIAAGWKRSHEHGHLRMSYRLVTKDWDTDRWHGSATKYRWAKHRWHRVDKHALRPHSDRAAFRYGGWRVKGLPRY
ncbi:hypothetical protein [Solicola gregarius]|uniref:VCBS repeat-containing protein n=1 Tax=Solicola gregarius TaxID=2908642 RepID=A0AA46YNE6_9ACTN|nr:hypothetical protein [Solicola gregarius]UYM07529.1 VCBS repeat-containing protein [Solicola gregarius]